jgi:uncharacterized membrane protein YfcA
VPGQRARGQGRPGRHRTEPRGGDISEFWLLFVIVFFAFAIKSLTGFGNTLIVNGGFSFLKENRFTTPMELLWNIPANAWMAWKDRSHLDLRLVLPFCVFTAVGDVIGTWLLAVGEDPALKTALGLLMIFLAAEQLFNRRIFKPDLRVGLAVALASGVLTGVFGVGALVAAWFNKLSDRKESYRANLCAVFLADNLVRTATYAAAGLLTAETIKTSALLLPAVGLGLLAGRAADRRLDARAIRLLVIALLLVSGIAIVAKYAEPLLRSAGLLM